MRFLTTLLAISVLATFVVGCSGTDKESVRIGALLPLTGALQSYGEASQAALELASDAINKDARITVNLVVKDTTTDPGTALSLLQALHDDGIKVVIGPYASSEVAAVKDYADSNGIVLISPLSTAGSLAVAGDNVYRFTPDDGKEAEAVAAVALDDGITTIVPVTRDDAGNLGLQTALKKAFEAGGGTVADGVSYGANETNFSSVLDTIDTVLSSTGGDPAKTAVYLTGFSEVGDLLALAATTRDEALSSVKWYGSDSVALSADLVQNAAAAGFAVKVGYPNPILGLRDEDQPVWQPVVDKLQAELGRRPDSFALAAYDALVVAQIAIQDAGVDADASALGTAIVKAAGGHTGLTGPTVLNEAGDRASASFDFWAICPMGSGFTWTRTISYAVAADGTGEVKRSDC